VRYFYLCKVGLLFFKLKKNIRVLDVPRRVLTHEIVAIYECRMFSYGITHVFIAQCATLSVAYCENFLDRNLLAQSGRTYFVCRREILSEFRLQRAWRNFLHLLDPLSSGKYYETPAACSVRYIGVDL